MLKRLRAKHPVGFCVLSEVLFLGSLLLASYLIVFALVLFGVDLERVDSYFLSAVQEAVGMVVALVILGRTGKMYLLRRRGSGFFNGLLAGMYPRVLIGYSLYTKLMFGMPEDGQLQPAFSIFSFFFAKSSCFASSFNNEEESSTNDDEVNNCAQEATVCDTVP